MRRFTVVLVLALMAAAASGAGEARAASCLDTTPGIMPVSEVAALSSGPGGLAAHGLTVSRGTTVEQFDVTVLGVLDDGIAPGVDMILVETESPAITAAGGIWAGMSGSPVYADAAPNKLIGAVAYGLSGGPSKIGGLAAAEDMNRLLDLPAAAQQQTIQLSHALQKKSPRPARRRPARRRADSRSCRCRWACTGCGPDG